MKECFAWGKWPEGASVSAIHNGAARCEGVHQLHHIIKQQVLRREMPKLGLVLGDRRNMVRVCSRHHELLTNARIHFTRDELPESVEEFAAEHGLEWRLAHDYGEREEPDDSMTPLPSRLEL